MLTDLLPDIADRITQYCSVYEVKKLSLTCSKCRIILQPFIFQAVGIPTDTLEHNPEALEPRLEDFVPNTQVLRIIGANIPDAAFQDIAKLTLLRELNLKFSNSTDYAMSVVCGQLLALEMLNLSKSKITDEGMSFIQQLPALKKLVLHKCKITGVGFNCITGMNTLRSLDISGCVGIRDAGFARLHFLNRMEELNLAECNQMTDVGIANLFQLVDMKKLDLTRCQVSDVELNQLLELMPKLKMLRVKYCPYLSMRNIEYHARSSRSIEIIS